MAKGKDKDSVRGTTPTGVAKWASLHKPDTQFKAEGEYRVTLLLGGDEAEKMKKIVDDAISASVVKVKAENQKIKTIKRADPPYKPYVDKDGNETDLTAFNFKAKATGVRKDGTAWSFRPPVFDAKGTPLKDVQVWGGSKVKVAYELRPFYTQMVGAGVQAKLSAVQVIELVTGGGGRDAGAYGFSAEEGYEQGAMPAGDAAGADAGGDGSEF